MSQLLRLSKCRGHPKCMEWWFDFSVCT